MNNNKIIKKSRIYLIIGFLWFFTSVFLMDISTFDFLFRLQNLPQMYNAYLREYSYLAFCIAKALLFIYSIHNISVGLKYFLMTILNDKQKINENKKTDNGF